MPPFESHKLDTLLGPSGAFAAFTTTVTVIDFGRRRVRYATALFGIIKVGRWIAVDSGMNLRARQSGRSYTSYSRSNRPLTVSESDYTIVLKKPGGTEICPLQRFRTRAEAEDRLPYLARHLGCGIIS